MEVGAPEATELRVEVREEAPLQQRIVREIEARHDVGRAERDLLGLGEEVVRVAIEHHAAHPGEGHELFGDELRRVEDVEIELRGLLFAEDLERELALGKAAGGDGVVQIAAMKVGIGAADLHRLVP